MIKHLLCLLLFLLLSKQVFAINPIDKIAPNDKQLHCMASYIITDVLQDGWEWDWWRSALGIYGLSLVKEQLDVIMGGKWDNTDIYANMCGYGFYNIVNIKLEF